MKLDNWTALTTNSSSMIYVLRDGMEEKAAELLKEYNIVFKTEADFPEFAKDYPDTAGVARKYGEKEIAIPFWERPPYTYDTAHSDEWWEKYYEATKEYSEQVREAIGDNHFTWFIPDHEDSEMSEEEIKIYKYLSRNWDRTG